MNTACFLRGLAATALVCLVAPAALAQSHRQHSKGDPCAPTIRHAIEQDGADFVIRARQDMPPAIVAMAPLAIGSGVKMDRTIFGTSATGSEVSHARR